IPDGFGSWLRAKISAGSRNQGGLASRPRPKNGRDPTPYSERFSREWLNQLVNGKRVADESKLSALARKLGCNPPVWAGLLGEFRRSRAGSAADRLPDGGGLFFGRADLLADLWAAWRGHGLGVFGIT